MYEALVDVRGEFGGPLAEEVWVVAPLTVQSATSHGVTFHTPLMVSEERVSEVMRGTAVDGRPADCVKLAICSLWPERFGEGSAPDLVVSGINAGANIGINVIYSGTVAAALEAAFLGVPSVAVSLHMGAGSARFDVAARHARRVLEMIVGGGIGAGKWLEPHGCLNVNIPLCQENGPTPDEPEIVVGRMNTHGLVDSYEKRVSPSGDVYYWASGSGLDFRGADPGTDVEGILRRAITVTPLLYDLTHHTEVAMWRRRLER